MTREKTVVPTTILDWLRVSGLMPDQKLILLGGLWGGRYTSSVGVAQVPIRPLAATLGLDPAALATGIETLAAAELVAWDPLTCEAFCRRWFSFHVFSGRGRGIAASEFRRIQSPTIRAAVVREAPWLAEDKMPPTPTTENQQLTHPTATATAIAAAGGGKNFRLRPSGIATWGPGDEAEAERIEAAFGSEAIAAAVAAVVATGKDPVPGLILRAFRVQKRKATKPPEVVDLSPTPEGIEAGLRRFPQLRGRVAL